MPLGFLERNAITKNLVAGSGEKRKLRGNLAP
jgi:hypothetical protein